MNRNSTPSQNGEDEPDFNVNSKPSVDGASSQEKEESKSQSQSQEPQSNQGLYISLTLAQAYSIMKNIPKQFRLIERSNLRKPSSRDKTKQGSTPRRSRKNDMV